MPNRKSNQKNFPTLGEYLEERAASVRDSAANVFIDQQLPDVPTVPVQKDIVKALSRAGMPDKALYTVFGKEKNPFTCIYSVTTKYGDKGAIVPGNITFAGNPTNYGFKQIPMNIDSIGKGDLVQFTPRGTDIPGHAAMITGDYYDVSNKRSLPFVSYSRGGTGAETNVNGKMKPTMVHGKPLHELIQESGKPSVYRYVGSPQKQQEWIDEYNKKYGTQRENGRLGVTARWSEGGSLKGKSAWDSLSMAEKAEMMKVAVRNGITTLPEIRAKYNDFAEGGDTNPGMTGMMKSKLATAAHFGNPTARRMANYDTRSYTWPGEYEYDNGIGEPKRGQCFCWFL